MQNCAKKPEGFLRMLNFGQNWAAGNLPRASKGKNWKEERRRVSPLRKDKDALHKVSSHEAWLVRKPAGQETGWTRNGVDRKDTGGCHHVEKARRHFIRFLPRKLAGQERYGQVPPWRKGKDALHKISSHLQLWCRAVTTFPSNHNLF